MRDKNWDPAMGILRESNDNYDRNYRKFELPCKTSPAARQKKSTEENEKDSIKFHFKHERWSKKERELLSVTR